MINTLDFIKTLALFLAIDLVYLRVIRKDFIDQYFSKFGGFKNNSALFGLLAWCLLAFGIQYFAVDQSRSKQDAAIKGALLGLVIYGVYDLTNYVTIQKWTMNFTIQDTLWGMILCGTIAYLRR